MDVLIAQRRRIFLSPRCSGSRSHEPVQEDQIVSEALTVVVNAYKALARRAELAKDMAKTSSTLWLLCACEWLSDLADALILA
jgi:hypothetical protein